MKHLALALFMIGTTAFGSGKLSVEPRYFFKSQQVAPAIGLSIYEKIVFGVAYNGWTGAGWAPRVGESSVMWFTSRHDLEKWFGDLGVSVGLTLRYAEQQDAALLNDQDVHIKFTWKLW